MDLIQCDNGIMYDNSLISYVYACGIVHVGLTRKWYTFVNIPTYIADSFHSKTSMGIWIFRLRYRVFPFGKRADPHYATKMCTHEARNKVIKFLKKHDTPFRRRITEMFH